MTGNQEPADPFAIDWYSAAAEAELQAVEAAFFSNKRTISDVSSSSDHPSPSPLRRCLPGWNSGPRTLPSNHHSSSDHQSPSPLRRCLPEWSSGPRTLPSNHGTSQDVGVRDRRGVDGFSGLAPRPCRGNYKLRHPSITFGGRIVYCRTTPEVEHAALDLLDKIRDLKQNAHRVSLGFDIEWKPVFTRGEAPNKAAVMQICVDMSHCYVMHIIHSGIPPSLKSLLEDFSSVKVGVCIANDAAKMWKDYNVSVEPLEDLSVVANLKLGGYKNWSLAALTETLTCKELAKPGKIRMGNWEAFPLSKEQLQYAATDAFISWHLYQILMSFPDCKPDNGNEERVEDVKPGSKIVEEAYDVKHDTENVEKSK